MSFFKDKLTHKVEECIRANGIVFWLDTDSRFSSFIDLLETDFTNKEFYYPIYRFNGSFLEVMLALRNSLEGKLGKPSLLCYVPKITSEQIKKTPLLEVYKFSYHITETLPEFIKEICIEYLTEEQINKLLVVEPLQFAEVEKTIESFSMELPPIEKFLALEDPTRLALAILREDKNYLKDILKTGDVKNSDIESYLQKKFGFDVKRESEFFHLNKSGLIEPNEKANLFSFRFPLANHLLCSEYVLDLRINPNSERLQTYSNVSEEIKSRIFETVEEFRKTDRNKYEELAYEIEGANSSLFQENITADNLGQIDTFPFEDKIILDTVLTLLENKDWNKALSFCNNRWNHEEPAKSKSFWILFKKERASLWEWAYLYASIGQLLQEAFLLVESSQFKPNTIDEFIPSYVELQNGLHRIDSFYRKFLYASAKLSNLFQIDNYLYLITLKNKLTEDYKRYSEVLNQKFLDTCRKSGFLPYQKKQQRQFFYHLKNWKSSKTAIFFVDALRYELGLELFQRMQKELSSVYKDWEFNIDAIYSELPSVTSVGMNALIPLMDDNGYISPVIDKDNKINGFYSNTFQVASRSQREKLLLERNNGNGFWINLKDFLNPSKKDLDSIKKNHLLIVHSLEIDEMGERGLLSLIYNHFDQVLTEIILACKFLISYGYESIIITADHGFLQLDSFSSPRTNESFRPLNLQRRYAIHSDAIESDKYYSVPLSELNYTVKDNKYLVFNKSIDFMTNEKKDLTFFHGGNTIQERLIPVLELRSRIHTELKKEIPNKFQLSVSVKESRLENNKVLVSVISDSGLFDNAFKPKFSFHIEPIESDVQIEILAIQGIVPSTTKGNTFSISPGETIEVEFKLISYKFSGKTQIKFIDQSLDSTPKTQLKEFFPVMNFSNKEEISEIKSSNKKIHSIQGIEKEMETILNSIFQHGYITESAIVQLFGGEKAGARVYRRFNLFLDEFSSKISFSIEKEQSVEGNTFRKVDV